MTTTDMTTVITHPMLPAITDTTITTTSRTKARW